MIEEGEQETVTAVMVGGAAVETTTLVKPDLVVSCVEVAVTVAVPAPLAVNTPAELTVPIFEGLTDQLTAVL